MHHAFDARLVGRAVPISTHLNRRKYGAIDGKN
jgi:hypothetical protein